MLSRIRTVSYTHLDVYKRQVFTVSAADNHSVDENTTYVTNFAELEKALEATSNETNPPAKLVVLKNNIDDEEQVPGDWSYQDEQDRCV